MDNLASRLKELRRLSSLTQRQTSLKLGVTERSYQRFESGENKPSLSNLIELANIFNVSLDFLVGREGQFNDSLYKRKSDIL